MKAIKHPADHGSGLKAIRHRASPDTIGSKAAKATGQGRVPGSKPRTPTKHERGDFVGAPKLPDWAKLK